MFVMAQGVLSRGGRASEGVFLDGEGRSLRASYSCVRWAVPRLESCHGRHSGAVALAEGALVKRGGLLTSVVAGRHLGERPSHMESAS